MKYVYPAIFSKCKEGGYSVCFPDLPGCFTQGADLAEALFMAEDAASGWLLVTMEQGEEVPKASDINDLKHDNGSFINMVLIDTNSYKRSERKRYAHLATVISVVVGAIVGFLVAHYRE